MLNSFTKSPPGFPLSVEKLNPTFFPWKALASLSLLSNDPCLTSPSLHPSAAALTLNPPS
jgi:hypothetical protein